MDAGRLLYFFNERRYLGDANQEDQILVLIVLPRASEHVLGKAAKRLFEKKEARGRPRICCIANRA